MMPSHVDSIKSVISRELEATLAFIAILQRESEVLASMSDPDALADVTQAKWYRANALNARHMERIALLETLQIKNNPDELAASEPDIKTLWDQLKPALQQARAMNAEHGVMIQHYLKATEQAMAVLRTSSGSNEVYAANGRTVSKGTRVLAAS